MSNPRTRKIAALLLPYLALVAVHLLSGMQMEQPIILADELGYLGNARYLSGTAHLPNMQDCQFYHFGYSLLLFPAFWLFSDPVAVYRAAIAINALLISSLYFPLYSILTSKLQTPKKTARWIAFACCLYPSLVLYSDFAWSENAFVPIYAVAAALFGRYLASRNSRDALLFGLVAGFLYTIHPRALPVLAIILGYLAVLALLKVLPKIQVLLSASTIGAVFFLTRLVNDHLKAVGWQGGGEYSAATLAGRLIPGSSFPMLIERAFGQILYLAQASHGLFLVGLVAVIWMIFRKATAESPRRVLADPTTGVPIFVLMTAAGIFAASCTSKLFGVHGPDGILGAEFIHGRYNEAFAVLLIAFALAEYCRKGLSRRRLVWCVLGVVAAVACLTVVVSIEVDDALKRQVAGKPWVEPNEQVMRYEVDAVNVPGVFPLIGVRGALKLSFISLVTMVSFVMITTTMRFSKRGGMLLLMFLFACFSLYNHRYYVLPAKARAEPRLGFVSELGRLGRIETISYDTAYLEPLLFYGVQYLMPQTVFGRFDSRQEDAPESEAVISGHTWSQAQRLGARFALSTGGWDNALWILPGELQSRLLSQPYEGVTLGAEPVFGFQESGFHQPAWFGRAPGRWTNGAASLTVPLDPTKLPEFFGIETLTPNRDGANLQILANGVELWNQRIPPEAWSKTFSLDRVPLDAELFIELISDTYSPAEAVAGSPDRRRLGVVIRGIRLSSRKSLAAAAAAGLTLGAERVFGFEESGFHQPGQFDDAPARWTNGAAALKVPLDPANLPRTLEIETAAPQRDGARLQIFANGKELWSGRVPSYAWSTSLDLEHLPLTDELLIELKSDTFVPAEKIDGAKDRRKLGVMVRGIRLTVPEGCSTSSSIRPAEKMAEEFEPEADTADQ